MKNRIILIGCIALITSLVVVLNHGIQGANVSLSTAFASDSKPDEILGVDQLMKNVDHYKGIIRVEGVVAMMSSDKGMLALIDRGEFTKCRVVTCSTLSLPVHWKGSMPIVGDTVKIKGQVKEQKGKLIFEAQELEGVAQQKGSH